MRIAFIVNVFPLLSETFVLNQITGLIDRGHEVHIHAHHPGAQGKIHADVEKYKLLQRLSKIDRPPGSLGALMGACGTLLRHPGKANIILQAINFSGRGKVESLQRLCQARQFIDADYDIVLCHFGPNGAFAASLKEKRLISGKLLTVYHGYDITTYLKAHEAGVYNSLFATGDMFLPVSYRWKEKLIELGCPQDKIVVHRMGIDVDKFTFRNRDVAGSVVKLVTVGRLVEKKGIEFGIKAVAAHLDQHPGCRLEYKIAGDGPLLESLQRLVAELGREQEIRLLGWQDQAEIDALLDEADIFLGPSVTSKQGDQEGLPVVLMEALAKGLIVCATVHSGIPELIEDGVTGFLVPEFDVPALSDKLNYIIEHRDLWPDISGNGYDRVSSEYNIRSLNAGLEALFETALRAG